MRWNDHLTKMHRFSFSIVLTLPCFQLGSLKTNHRQGQIMKVVSWYMKRHLGILVCFVNTSPFLSLFSWASHTLECFPEPLKQFYPPNSLRQETKQVLKQRVEEEYRRWKCKYLYYNTDSLIARLDIVGRLPKHYWPAERSVLEMK